MSAIVSSLWTILTSYRPNAARDRQAKRENGPLRYGAFEATYRPPGFGVRRPKNDVEAQRMYNHIRTVAFWLDAAPLLSDLGLPFRAGLDDIISLVPIYGDILSGVLQLYQVWLCFVFGVPRNLLGMMILNVVLDVIVGLVPIIGDFLDNLFKSNLRNLAILETYLLTDPIARGKYHILLMPEGTEFLPKVGNGRDRWGAGWFSGGRAKEDAELEDEARTGRVRVTRRVKKEEAEGWARYAADGGATGMAGAGAGAGGAGPSGGTRSARARASATANGSGNGPMQDPLD